MPTPLGNPGECEVSQEDIGGVEAVEAWLEAAAGDKKLQSAQTWNGAYAYFQLGPDVTPEQIWEKIRAVQKAQVERGAPTLSYAAKTFVNEIIELRMKWLREHESSPKWLKGGKREQLNSELLYDPLHKDLQRKWEEKFGRNEYGLQVLAGQSAVSLLMAPLDDGNFALINGVRVNGYVLTGNADELPPEEYSLAYEKDLSDWTQTKHELNNQKAIRAMSARINQAATLVAGVLSQVSRVPNSRTIFIADMLGKGVKRWRIGDQSAESDIKRAGVYYAFRYEGNLNELKQFAFNDRTQGPVSIASTLSLDSLNPEDLRRALDEPLNRVGRVINGGRSSRR